jgi:predicted Fe-S protein YdhL (DUF1289 family)
MSDKAAVTAKVNAKGQEIREAKAKKADKQAIMKMVRMRRSLERTVAAALTPSQYPSVGGARVPAGRRSEGPESRVRDDHRRGVAHASASDQEKKAAWTAIPAEKPGRNSSRHEQERGQKGRPQGCGSRSEEGEVW